MNPREQLSQIVSLAGVSRRVLSAFSKIDRADFVPKEFKPEAYEDRPIPLPESQTTSQPSLIALIADKLGIRKGDRVLEVGTGFGFQTALLSELVGPEGLVVSIEFLKPLHERAKENLAGRKNLLLVQGDGRNGFPEKAPYDAIVVSAASEGVPAALFVQLKKGGTLAYPHRSAMGQDLLFIEKTTNEKASVVFSLPVSFVPLR